MKLIGKGAFTKCYLLDCGKKVKLKSIDSAKECAALGWGSSDEMFPEIKRTDLEEYEMKFYPKVRSLKAALLPDQWEFYKKLRKIGENVRAGRNDWDYINGLRAEFSKLPQGESLNEHLDGLLNYGSDIGFEIYPRNVAAENGKLILLDCFFFRGKLMEARKKLTNLELENKAKNFLTFPQSVVS